ncbi:hypothetical protein [Euryhalocaulis caribicus]|uniref:hypothetical protein n=1 Tax=Euryhalocaulis caribicus TaxID=1161401 RepID=UPI00039F6D3D|nr:hypothetical protein [Euryhalocaulis caribicus]
MNREMPVREMSDKRFTVSCDRCPRLKRFSYGEFLVKTKPHPNEYLDEVAKRFRCWVAREHKRACPIRIEVERVKGPS